MATTVEVLDHARIGTALRELRRERGLTQAELARRLKLGQSTISEIERGEIHLTLDLAALYCREFRVSPDWVFRMGEGRE
jgi:transcriptional regulator with XRE-family HTH domain